MVLAARPVHLVSTQAWAKVASCAYLDRRQTRRWQLMRVNAAFQTRLVYLGQSVLAVRMVLWLTRTERRACVRVVRITQQALLEAMLCSVWAIGMFRQATEKLQDCACHATACRASTAELESRRYRRAMPRRARMRHRAVRGFCLHARWQRHAYRSQGRGAGQGTLASCATCARMTSSLWTSCASLARL